MAEGSNQIKALAASLDKKIELAQRWFASLPGKVQVETSLRDPESPTERTLEVRLASPHWRFEFRRRSTNAHLETGWNNLSTAGLNIKIAAIEAFPQLLSNMRGAQQDLIDRLANANKKIDEFAKVAGLDTEEGK